MSLSSKTQDSTLPTEKDGKDGKERDGIVDGDESKERDGHEEEEEEATILTASTTMKATGNSHFTSGDFNSAIASYNNALSTCPSYFDYNVAVLHSNVAACRIKQKKWKDAERDAGQALECLERIDPPVSETTPAENGDDHDSGSNLDSKASIYEEQRKRVERLHRTGHNFEHVQELRVKTLLRRGKAREEIGSWASLQGALEDYTTITKQPDVSLANRSIATIALKSLPPRLESAKQSEMAEMMGKLKSLGNGILKPFGLSTDNFSVNKDETSGGYNLSFNQDGP